MPKPLKVADLAAYFHLEVLAGADGMQKTITVADLHRPGLVLAGYMNYYASERVQLLGKTELSFFQTLPAEVRKERAVMLCRKETPCLLVTRGLEIGRAHV